MKQLIFTFFLLGLMTISCQNQHEQSLAENEIITIKLDGLSDNHPNKASMEWFLNNYKEAFVLSTEKWNPVIHDTLVQKGFYFKTENSKIGLTLIFCEHQNDALKIAEANYPVIDDIQTCGVNGAVLFVAEGRDQSKVNDVLQWFAGEE